MLRRRDRFVRVVNVAIANLAGVPVIVFGLFALIFFIQVLRGGYNAITGILAMSLLELPIIIQASKDALLRVPEGFKTAAYAVGSTKWQAVRHQVLPYAWSGVLTGTILALARDWRDRGDYFHRGLCTDYQYGVCMVIYPLFNIIHRFVCTSEEFSG